MRKLILIPLFLLFFSSVALAGNDPILFGGYGGISLGAQYLNLSDLNDYLEPVNLDGHYSTRPYIGLHGHGIIFEHFLIGGRGGFSMSNTDTDGLDSLFASINGHMEFGYLVLNGRYGLLAPLIGLGGFSTQLYAMGDVWRLGFGDRPNSGTSDDPRIGDATYGNVLEDVELVRGGMYSFIGVTYQYPFRFAESRTGGFAMALAGVTAGATIEMFDSGWKEQEDNLDVDNGPEIPFHSFMLNIEISFGGGTTATYYQTETLSE